ncbi:MAG TPA: UDP-N-acetylmuramoyl-L-alanyl-D-glutamate--2,6-diaminopimelate ligase [Thermoanaerobaculia bacterium]|jgi:UDP-N-acetylmuramoyl-L-alanyl-D-glutamate--2,6-diaminopimelate ligase|nr:UDP-N-acetylmuramoyl-L-alanyl-D-glutamate--2,6-diaminopimelate ligase [Thermoanaerobaculia bacterium]
MRLPELVAGLPVAGDIDAPVEVSGIQHDSRQVEAGDLYAALPGARYDGRRFAPDAVARGAVAVLAAGPAEQPVDVPWLLTEQPRALLAPLAHRLYGRPDRELLMVGVTGTNGKSTVVWLCQAVLQAAGKPAARLGTISYAFGDLELPAQRTTPEVSDLVRMLRLMRDRGAVAACMEVSSHALVLDRLGETRFDAGVFTNLTRDHLDFHGTMEEYYLAKRRLFTERLKPGGVAVVHAGDPYGKRLAAELRQVRGAAAPARIVSYGEGGEVRVVEARLEARATHARVATPRGELALETRLLGPFNLENLLAAVALGEALELPTEAVIAGLAEVAPVPGRMEAVDRGQSFPVFVDYAHTDDGLANALRAVRAIAGPGRKVVVVFGCGGDRDRGKRPLMGKVAGELADLVLVTSDNPRSEDPLAIMGAIEEGVKASGNESYRLLPDRRDAIRRAIAVAGPDWAVLIAGKGNEEGQEIAGTKQPFSDRDEAIRALEERPHAANGG